MARLTRPAESWIPPRSPSDDPAYASAPEMAEEVAVVGAEVGVARDAAAAMAAE